MEVWEQYSQKKLKILKLMKNIRHSIDIRKETTKHSPSRTSDSKFDVKDGSLIGRGIIVELDQE